MLPLPYIIVDVVVVVAADVVVAVVVVVVVVVRVIIAIVTVVQVRCDGIGRRSVHLSQGRVTSVHALETGFLGGRWLLPFVVGHRTFTMIVIVIVVVVVVISLIRQFRHLYNYTRFTVR